MLSYDDFRTLAAVSGPCLTIFHPLRADDAVLAASIHEGERLLTGGGMDAAARREMIRPFHKIAANMPWKGRNGSLVMFHSPGFTITEFWADELEAQVHYSQEFFVLPLLRGLLKRRHFWLLALSIQHVRLYRGSSSGITEVQLPDGIAKSLAADGAFDKPDHTLRGRSSAGPSSGSMKGVQFGTSQEHDRQADYLHDYFRAIDKGIGRTLAGDPLILAAVTRELAIYRKVNSYARLLESSIHGSPDSMGPAELHAKAAEVMAANSCETEKTMRLRMDDAAGRRLLVERLSEILDAADNGRVEELLVPELAGSDVACDETINLVALATLRHSGRIGILREPGASLTAILRYRTNERNGTTRTANAV